MSNQQQSLYSDFEKIFYISIIIGKKGWYWLCEGEDSYRSEDYFNSAADAEQNLITFLKNYEGFRNG